MPSGPLWSAWQLAQRVPPKSSDCSVTGSTWPGILSWHLRHVLSRTRRKGSTWHVAQFLLNPAWPEASGRKGEMEKYLDALGGGQVYVHVLRAFDSPILGDEAHPGDDLAELDNEFLMFDLIRIERAFERSKKAPIPDSGKKALAKCQEHLEAETPLREVDFDESDLAFVRGYQFLTLTPQLLLLNTGSGATPDMAALEGPARGRRLMAFPFPDALEVSQLSMEEQAEYAAALGLPGPAAEIVAQAAFEQLGLISFLTSGSDEVRAW